MLVKANSQFINEESTFSVFPEEEEEEKDETTEPSRSGGVRESWRNKRDEYNKRKLEGEWLRIIEEWDGLASRRERSVKKLCFEYGLPPSLRSKIWSLFVGNKLQMNTSLFDILSFKGSNQEFSLISLELHELHEEEEEEENGGEDGKDVDDTHSNSSIHSVSHLTRGSIYHPSSKEESLALIHTDIPRTRLFVPLSIQMLEEHNNQNQESKQDELEEIQEEMDKLNEEEKNLEDFENLALDEDEENFFDDRVIVREESEVELMIEEVTKDEIKSVLQAFVMYRPDVGYVQGFVLISLNFFNFPRHELCMWILVSLLPKRVSNF